MLSLLHIENIAVIEQADISFDKGFNVLTGETGAGKSIVSTILPLYLTRKTICVFWMPLRTMEICGQTIRKSLPLSAPFAGRSTA